jgi:hypothetical protein
MAALNVFRQVGRLADSDFLAMEVLPIVWSMSLGPLLNLEQVRLNERKTTFLSSYGGVFMNMISQCYRKSKLSRNDLMWRRGGRKRESSENQD